MSIFETLKFFLWREQMRVVRRYYRKSLRFALFDLSLSLLALFINPYRLCRKYWAKKNGPFPFYGETPLTTLEAITRCAHLSPSDTYLELGSGRGRGCLWVSQMIGCKVIGVEEVPYFARTSQFLSRCFRIPALSFRVQDMFETDFSQATFVYLYATGLSRQELSRLTQAMKGLPRGAKVVTVSNPLSRKEFLVTPLSRKFPFPWGDAGVFINIKN